ncbi:MAG: arginine--tRNA ligase [Patescibacteria group bacterium]|nr:arginine--tRNA ligase [Patescibacteria group bacterium]MBU1877288.1 arginine--tRNA ligase [Patescibacteria group bacterium]
MIKDKISQITLEAIQSCQKQENWSALNISEIKIESPKDKKHGDYAVSIALEIGKMLKKNPLKISEIIKNKILEEPSILFNKIEVVSPGFINFFLAKDYLISELSKVLKEKDKYGAGNTKKTIVIDYSAPNIAKPFGIGHLRSTIIGQSIYNLYKFFGFKCIGDNHLGDWGTQFGKMIVAIKKWVKQDNFNDLTVNDLEKLYIRFHQEIENHPEIEEEARLWFKKLENGDKEAKDIWQICVNVSLKEFNKIYDLLGIKIDYAFGESFYEGKMMSIVQEAIDKKIAIKSQGAVIIDYPDKLPTVIILKSDGATNYFTRDLAAIKYRLKKWKPDLIVYETGAEQTLHFKQLFEAVELLKWTSKDKLVHISHGLYRSRTGKFSTRKGQTIHLEEILIEAIKRAKQMIENSEAIKNLSNQEKEEIAKIVGIGAVKYNDLSQHHSRDIIFDWDKILNLKGNSGPYLQYTHARCISILRKTKTKLDLKKIKNIKLNSEEEDILRDISRFPEIVREAVQKFSPNLICSFIFDLSQRYNLFYQFHPVIKAETEESKILRLAITTAVAQILKNSLALLGIDTPNKM